MFKKSILYLLLLVGLIAWFGSEVSLRAQTAGGQKAETASAETAKRSPDTLFSIIFSGGPVGITIMLVLFGVSITAAYLVFEHMFTIRRQELLPEGLGEKVRQSIIAGNFPQADQACRAKPSFLAAVLLRGLSETENGWSEVEKALEEGLAEQAARLFRKIEYLALIGNIAPMLGFQGTLTDMKSTLQHASSPKSTASPSSP